MPLMASSALYLLRATVWLRLSDAAAVPIGVCPPAVLVAVAHVLTVGPGVTEALVAVVTDVRFVSGVKAPVFRQVMFVLKRFAANVTLKRTQT